MSESSTDVVEVEATIEDEDIFWLIAYLVEGSHKMIIMRMSDEEAARAWTPYQDSVSKVSHWRVLKLTLSPLELFPHLKQA